MATSYCESLGDIEVSKGAQDKKEEKNLQEEVEKIVEGVTGMDVSQFSEAAATSSGNAPTTSAGADKSSSSK